MREARHRILERGNLRVALREPLFKLLAPACAPRRLRLAHASLSLALLGPLLAGLPVDGLLATEAPVHSDEHASAEADATTRAAHSERAT